MNTSRVGRAGKSSALARVGGVIHHTAGLLGPWGKSPATSTAGSGQPRLSQVVFEEEQVAEPCCLGWELWWFWLQKQSLSHSGAKTAFVMQSPFLISSCVNCHCLVSEPLA